METNGQMDERVANVVGGISIEQYDLSAGQRTAGIAAAREIRLDGTIVVVDDTWLCFAKNLSYFYIGSRNVILQH